MKSTPIALGIEPWAQVEELGKDDIATFEYLEPADIDFSIDSDGGATVVIVSEWFKITANGRERIFKTDKDGYIIVPP